MPTRRLHLIAKRDAVVGSEGTLVLCGTDVTVLSFSSLKIWFAVTSLVGACS
jgi:hypothetical protein